MSDIFIHTTSVVDAGAKIGNGTKIWHFCHIMTGSEIGENCQLGQNVFMAPGAKIGNGVKVQNNVSIYDGVLCEDDVFIGPSCVFTNIKIPRSFISQKDKFVKTIVRKGASIGANVTIVCGVEIGKYAMIGAGAVVTHDVPAYALMVGNPAKQIGFVDREGEIINDENIIFGKVIHGLKIGRKLGFPTANLEVNKHAKIPKEGVYAVYVSIRNEEYKGLLSIGHRSSVDSDGTCAIEVNIFDFEADIYGENIIVKIIKFIREQQKFPDLENLKAALVQDRIKALSIFNSCSDV